MEERFGIEIMSFFRGSDPKKSNFGPPKFGSNVEFYSKSIQNGAISKRDPAILNENGIPGAIRPL